MTPPAGGTERKPSVRQVYALAAALCTWTGVEFPRTQAEASELLEGIRHDIGHPQPRLFAFDEDIAAAGFVELRA